MNKNNVDGNFFRTQENHMNNGSRLPSRGSLRPKTSPLPAPQGLVDLCRSYRFDVHGNSLSSTALPKRPTTVSTSVPTKDFERVSSAQKINRLKGAVGRRYLTEALDMDFAEPMEKCKCLYALIAVQEIFGDTQGLVKELSRILKQLRPLLDTEEAQDMFADCVEKLLKIESVPLNRKCALVEEALKAVPTRRESSLKSEYDKIAERRRENEALSYQRSLWSNVAPKVLPFLASKRNFACVSRLLSQAVRESKEKRVRRARSASPGEASLKSHFADFPECKCGTSMVVTWSRSKQVLVCQQSPNGCDDIRAIDHWQFQKQTRIDVGESPIKEPTIEKSQLRTDFLTPAPPERNESDYIFLTDSADETDARLRLATAPTESLEPSIRPSIVESTIPENVVGQPNNGDNSPIQLSKHKRRAESVFQMYLDSRSWNGGKKGNRIPKEMLLDEMMMKNQLGKLSNYSMIAKVERNSESAETAALKRDILSSVNVKRDRPLTSSPRGSIIEIRKMISKLTKIEDTEHLASMGTGLTSNFGRRSTLDGQIQAALIEAEVRKRAAADSEAAKKADAVSMARSLRTSMR